MVATKSIHFDGQYKNSCSVYAMYIKSCSLCQVSQAQLIDTIIACIRQCNRKLWEEVTFGSTCMVALYRIVNIRGHEICSLYIVYLYCVHYLEGPLSECPLKCV